MLAHLLCHLECQVGTSIVHGQQDCTDAQLGVQVLLNHLNILQQLAQTFQSVVLALDRNQNLFCRNEGIDGQQAEARRAVDEDIVQALHTLLLAPFGVIHQGILEASLACHQGDQFNLRARKVDIGGGTEQAGHIGAFLNNFRKRLILNQDVVDTGNIHAVLNAQCGRGVTLRVVVDHQDIQPSLRERGCEVHGGAGFTHATLLVRHGEDTRMHRLGEQICNRFLSLRSHRVPSIFRVVCLR